jgi:6-phosphofructokinase
MAGTCKVIAVPASIDGNLYSSYLQSTIGFDTCSKVYSQLVGNMLTDSASAVKYWYFVRLMGHQASHMAVEVALKTSPNMVIVAEEANARHEQLSDIVNNICDTVVARSKND